MRTLLFYASGYPTWKRLVADTASETFKIDPLRLPSALRDSRLGRYLLEGYRTLSYLVDWREAFLAEPGLHIDVCNTNNLLQTSAALRRLRDYELVVVLHSATGDDMGRLTKWVPHFQGRKGKLLLFFGNEYDLMPEKIGFAQAVEAEYIASQLPLESARWLYADSELSTVLPAPFALNPSVYRPGHGARPIDVGFRGDLHPLWIGDDERNGFLRHFQSVAPTLGLSTDLLFNKRYPRDSWQEFLNRCKGIVGAESGTYFLERDDRTKKAVLAFLAERPTATFREVYDLYFRDYGPSVSGKAISGRHFEAIGTKTCQVLLHGRYNDILVPDEHYIAVAKDYSNLDDAIARFGDESYRRRVVDRAYDHVLSAHTYAHRVRSLLDAVVGGSG